MQAVFSDPKRTVPVIPEKRVVLRMRRGGPLRVEPAKPVSEEFVVRGMKISNQQLEQFEKACRPTPEMLAGMIQHLRESKKWSYDRLAILLGSAGNDLRLIEVGKKSASRPLMRSIWMLYALDKAPQCLFDLFFFASWGRTQGVKPKSTWAKPEDGVKVVAQLKAMFGEGRHLTIKALQAKFRAQGIEISDGAVRRYCKKAGYRNARAKRGGPRKTDLFRPDRIWMKIDWSMTNREIAKRYGYSYDTVWLRRRELAAVPPQRLAHFFRASGRTTAEAMAVYKTIHGVGASGKAYAELSDGTPKT